MVGTQCPPWGGHMASAVRDAYEVQAGGWPPGWVPVVDVAA